MSGLFGIGSSALLANQRALAITGNNIANANTDGYSRQRVDFTSRQATGMQFGAGVDADTVSRFSDRFANQRLADSTSRHSSLNAGAELAGRLDLMLSDPSTGLAEPLRQFYDAVDAWAANPAAPETRVQLLGQAETVAQRLDQLQTGIDTFNSELNARIDAGIEDINSLSQSLADLNKEIALTGYNGSGQGAAPNELLDKRDQLVQELSGKVNVSTALQSDGTLNVYVGTGQSLVVGTQATLLQKVPGATPGEPVGVSIAGADVTNTLDGGELGGLLGFRGEVLAPAAQQLRDISSALVSTVNNAQAAGADLNGNPGADLFTISPTTARIEVQFDDPDLLAAAAAGAPPNSGDNSNALALADALRAPALGNDSINEANIALVGQVGSTARRLQAAETAQFAVMQQNQSLRDEVSAVNLDEEAANMLRFQQAYQASAQIIATANAMFDSLLAAAR